MAYEQQDDNRTLRCREKQAMAAEIYVALATGCAQTHAVRRDLAPHNLNRRFAEES